MSAIATAERKPRTTGRSQSVEASGRAGKTSGVAFRQVWKPRVLCVVDPINPAEAVARIVPRIAENQRACGVASYLLIDPTTSQAFVLAEDKPVAVEMARLGERSPYWTWQVGLYRFTRATAESAADLLEDVRFHLGLVTPAPAGSSLPEQLDLFGPQEAAA